jgi:hypothetical protein
MAGGAAVRTVAGSQFLARPSGGTHSTAKAARGWIWNGPAVVTFGVALKQVLERGDDPISRLDDMVKRIPGAQFATGRFDPRTGVA